MSFKSFQLHPHIETGVTFAGYHTPTPIQSQAIPPILAGNDVLGLAQTGTGKTAAFALPILQRLMKGPRGRLRALVVAPTRELAEQIHGTFRTLGKGTGLRSVTLYGGVSALPQTQNLRSGAEIAVACPGRLLDLMDQGIVSLKQIEVLVLDEADHMFDMGFLPSIRRILSALPTQRQSLLFSATMPPEIRKLATECLKSPVTVEIAIEKPVESIRHAIYPVDHGRKFEMLLALLREVGEGQSLIFTRTKHQAKKIAMHLVREGLPATSLQGNLSQNARQAAMDSFRSGRARVMVATDIAARGIDVSQITHVINYDLPDTAEAYTHRTGRTGRMQRLGTALSLVSQPDDLLMVRTIERLLGHTLERRSMAGFDTPVIAAPAAAAPQPARPRTAPSARRRPAYASANRGSRQTASRG